jgi:outer membrane immunogenic protein
MKRTVPALLACIAFSHPAAAEKPFDWTGLYLGGHAGYAWSDVDQRQTNGGMPPGPFSYTGNGFVGGATAGYNLQAGMFVVGVEGDIGWMDLSGTGRIPSSNPAAHQDISLDAGAYGDITGRLGVAIGKTLIYGKGGWAFYNGEARQKTTNPGFVTHGTDSTFTGWTAGGGIEHAISQGLTVKLEYQHFDFGTENGDQTSVSDPPIGFVYRNSTNVTADSVKAGINFRF